MPIGIPEEQWRMAEHTMLFAGVRGSTTLAETMGATEYGEPINRFYVTGTDVLTRSEPVNVHRLHMSFGSDARRER